MFRLIEEPFYTDWLNYSSRYYNSFTLRVGNEIILNKTFTTTYDFKNILSP
ncbi:MAG: hypothetical protein ACTS4W_00415 [Candidatus Hodgkinia cicadicola]